MFPLKILKAVADATRLKLLGLIRQGEVCACELPSRAGVSQPAVSQHLKVLKNVGLVCVRSQGAKRLYRISAFGKLVLFDIGGWRS